MKALEKSIEHWKELAEAVSPESLYIGSQQCALCQAFHPSFRVNVGPKPSCAGCPVRERTGQPFCRGTPHEEARRALNAWYSAHRVGAAPNFDTKFREAARAEIAFLESLRE